MKVTRTEAINCRIKIYQKPAQSFPLSFEDINYLHSDVRSSNSVIKYARTVFDGEIYVILFLVGLSEREIRRVNNPAESFSGVNYSAKWINFHAVVHKF